MGFGAHKDYDQLPIACSFVSHPSYYNGGIPKTRQRLRRNQTKQFPHTDVLDIGASHYSSQVWTLLLILFFPSPAAGWQNTTIDPIQERLLVVNPQSSNFYHFCSLLSPCGWTPSRPLHQTDFHHSNYQQHLSHLKYTTLDATRREFPRGRSNETTVGFYLTQLIAFAVKFERLCSWSCWWLRVSRDSGYRGCGLFFWFDQ